MSQAKFNFKFSYTEMNELENVIGKHLLTYNTPEVRSMDQEDQMNAKLRCCILNDLRIRVLTKTLRSFTSIRFQLTYEEALVLFIDFGVHPEYLLHKGYSVIQRINTETHPRLI